MPHMQREDGGNWLVIADGEPHVTAVGVLRNPGNPTQPGCQAALQIGIVGWHW